MALLATSRSVIDAAENATKAGVTMILYVYGTNRVRLVPATRGVSISQ